MEDVLNTPKSFTLPTSPQQATLPPVMKRTLSPLPKHKQQELNEITSIAKANPGVEMVVLFGSYARGDWVEDTYWFCDGFGKELCSFESDADIAAMTALHAGRRRQSWMEFR